MKIRYKFGISLMSGTLDDLVHMPCHSGFGSFGRKWVYPTITDNNHAMGAILKNLALVWSEVNPDYHSDLVKYALRYFAAYNDPLDFDITKSSFALFVKMMYAWADSDPEHVDLSAVTIADIVALDADVQVICDAIVAGFLPVVDVYDDLINPITVP